MSFANKIFAHNWFAIIYFNLKMLPFKQAIRFPFDFYHYVRFEDLSGQITINSPHIRRAMIKIGGRGSEMFSRHTTIVDLKGSIQFSGIVEIGHGCLLRVNKDAHVIFGDRVRIGAMTKIFCNKMIRFGNEIDFSWNCQIFDTNFHDMIDLTTQKLVNRDDAIVIGSYNWFGNHVDVMKSTITPDYFTVAANSLCNKDYSDHPKYSIVGGYPSRIIGSNKARIFEE